MAAQRRAKYRRAPRTEAAAMSPRIARACRGTAITDGRSHELLRRLDCGSAHEDAQLLKELNKNLVILQVVLTARGKSRFREAQYQGADAILWISVLLRWKYGKLSVPTAMSFT
jgi:hypothetical protein